MSNALGCFRGEVHNAIAPVAGGLAYVLWGGCTGEVGVWLTHGDNDTVVEFSEGETAREYWSDTNTCSGTTVPATPEECVAYEGCERDVHWCQHSDGHNWPSFAGEAIWEFFKTQ